MNSFLRYILLFLLFKVGLEPSACMIFFASWDQGIGEGEGFALLLQHFFCPGFLNKRLI